MIDVTLPGKDGHTILADNAFIVIIFGDTDDIENFLLKTASPTGGHWQCFTLCPRPYFPIRYCNFGGLVV